MKNIDLLNTVANNKHNFMYLSNYDNLKREIRAAMNSIRVWIDNKETGEILFDYYDETGATVRLSTGNVNYEMYKNNPQDLDLYFESKKEEQEWLNEEVDFTYVAIYREYEGIVDDGFFDSRHGLHDILARNIIQYFEESAEDRIKAVIEFEENNHLNAAKFSPETHPVVAVDLDGTIWPEEYPHVSTPYPYAIKTINTMVEVGYDVILWTCRGGENLGQCLDALRKHGLSEEIIINTHAEYYTNQYPVVSPKVNASVYLDNKGYGAPSFADEWPNIYNDFII